MPCFRVAVVQKMRQAFELHDIHHGILQFFCLPVILQQMSQTMAAIAEKAKLQFPPRAEIAQAVAESRKSLSAP